MGLFNFNAGLQKKFASVSRNEDGQLVVGVSTNRFNDKGEKIGTEIVERPVSGHEELLAVANQLQTQRLAQG